MTPLVRDLHNAAQTFDSELPRKAAGAIVIDANARNEKLPGTNAEEFPDSQIEALFRGIWNRNLLVPKAGLEPARPKDTGT